MQVNTCLFVSDTRLIFQHITHFVRHKVVQFSGRKYQCTYSGHILCTDNVRIALESSTGHVPELRLIRQTSLCGIWDCALPYIDATIPCFKTRPSFHFVVVTLQKYLNSTKKLFVCTYDVCMCVYVYV